MCPLEYIFFLSNKHTIQQSLQQCLDCLLNFIGSTIKISIILALYVRLTFFVNMSCRVFILLFRAAIRNAIYFRNNSKNQQDFYLIMDQSDVLLHNQTITIKTLIILALYLKLIFFVNTSRRVFNYILLPRGFLYETKWNFLNNSVKFNALFSFNKCRRHVTALLESLNSFSKRLFITENVKSKPQFEILSPLEYIFFSKSTFTVARARVKCSHAPWPLGITSINQR